MLFLNHNESVKAVQIHHCFGFLQSVQNKSQHLSYFTESSSNEMMLLNSVLDQFNFITHVPVNPLQ